VRYWRTVTSAIHFPDPRSLPCRPALGVNHFQDACRLEQHTWMTSLVEDTTTPLATAEDGLRATEVAAALIASTSAGGAATNVGAV